MCGRVSRLFVKLTDKRDPSRTSANVDQLLSSSGGTGTGGTGRLIPCKDSSCHFGQSSIDNLTVAVKRLEAVDREIGRRIVLSRHL